MPALRRAFGLVVFFLLVVSSGCTSDSVPAGQCRYNADCDSPQVCVGTYCRAACLNDNDCPDNGLCARGLGGVYFCSARSAPRPCLYSSDCPATTFCTRDGICQARCRGDYDCQVISPYSSCVEGNCQLVCPPFFADCDSDVRNGCEADTRISASHCGRCANACTGTAGAAGTCRVGACVVTCSAGFADCDGDAANGCEADLSQSDHCGACATRCTGERGLCLVAMDPGTAARSYSCQPSCPAGTTTCGTRCTDLQSDPASCGRCDAACPIGVGANATCDAGRCGLRCTEPTAQGDCDGMAANGCEVELQRNATHCGVCGNACPARAHATPACSSGVCQIVCETGWGNCDGDAVNGCETDLATTGAHCGMCGSACAPRLNGSSVCVAGACVGSCAPGFGDCDGDTSNGCETNTASGNVTHCGSCTGPTAVCPTPPIGATALCMASTCMISSLMCPSDRRDCNGMVTDGCETNTNTTATACGGCGMACSTNHVSPTCTGGACTGTCATGFADCDGNRRTNGCELPVSADVNNCGACGNVCPARANATTNCAARACGFTCNAGFGNCDGVATNGCEVNLNTTASRCGGCGIACASDEVCEAGLCGLAQTCTFRWRRSSSINSNFKLFASDTTAVTAGFLESGAGVATEAMRATDGTIAWTSAGVGAFGGGAHNGTVVLQNSGGGGSGLGVYDLATGTPGATFSYGFGTTGWAGAASPMRSPSGEILVSFGTSSTPTWRATAGSTMLSGTGPAMLLFRHSSTGAYLGYQQVTTTHEQLVPMPLADGRWSFAVPATTSAHQFGTHTAPVGVSELVTINADLSFDRATPISGAIQAQAVVPGTNLRAVISDATRVYNDSGVVWTRTDCVGSFVGASSTTVIVAGSPAATFCGRRLAASTSRVAIAVLNATTGATISVSWFTAAGVGYMATSSDGDVYFALPSATPVCGVAGDTSTPISILAR